MFVIVALYVRAGLYKRFVIAHYGDKCLLCRFSITTNLLSSFRFCATFVSSLHHRRFLLSTCTFGNDPPTIATPPLLLHYLRRIHRSGSLYSSIFCFGKPP
jgi:hypothetical protein